ncbi:MAG: signal peptidase II [Tissierellia bacterium]|nr:signal peptidase II [Tissierellia bacterium]
MLFAIPIIIILIDQITKFLAVGHLQGKEPIVIIDNFLRFHYVENYGAAFGMLNNKRVFFIIVTTIVIISIIFFLFRYYSGLSIRIKIALAMLLGGAIGNLIDRVRLGYVIDFISVRLPGGYHFPVFNIADSFIVISTSLIMIIILTSELER